MSYCRRSDESDLYIFEIEDGRCECNCCPSASWPVWSVVLSKREMAEHVRLHAKRGDRVPAGLVDELEFDADADLSGAWECQAVYGRVDN